MSLDQSNILNPSKHMPLVKFKDSSHHPSDSVSYSSPLDDSIVHETEPLSSSSLPERSSSSSERSSSSLDNLCSNLTKINLISRGILICLMKLPLFLTQWLQDQNLVHSNLHIAFAFKHSYCLKLNQSIIVKESGMSIVNKL